MESKNDIASLLLPGLNAIREGSMERLDTLIEDENFDVSHLRDGLVSSKELEAGKKIFKNY